MRHKQPTFSGQLNRGIRPLHHLPILLGVVALTLPGLAGHLRAQPCSGDNPQLEDILELELPEGRDFIQESIEFGVYERHCVQGGVDSLVWGVQAELLFKGPGNGLFEAEIVLTETEAQLFEYSEGQVASTPVPMEASPPIALAWDDQAYIAGSANGTVPVAGALPSSFDASSRRWRFTRPFSDEYVLVLLASGTAMESHPDFTGEVRTFSVGRKFELKYSIRRIPNRCYMQAIVTGGEGAGRYSGDVAYFGNPTGLGSDTVAALEGMMAWAQELEASMGAQEGDDSESENAEPPTALSGLSAAVEGQESLTLQDVKLGSGGGTGSLGGFGEMISAFNLTAHDVTLGEPYEGEIFDDEGNAVGNLGTVQDGTATHLGLKAPGLAIANMRICGAAPPEILFTRCPGEQEINMEQSPYCGRLLGKVCHEAGHQLTVHAEFIAGDDVASCIR